VTSWAPSSSPPAGFSTGLPLLRGHVRWDAVKGLCDQGLVARFDKNTSVLPASLVAASVLQEVFARTEVYAGRACLASFAAGSQSGTQLEAQVIIALSISTLAVVAANLDGSAARVNVLNDFRQCSILYCACECNCALHPS
jgi:hypothetical protein